MNNHYQTLKVSRDAPLEVIRMAYKVLCQKYHPDKYPDNRAAAVQVMKALNAAYAVLSDPAKRKDYDEFLDEAEALNEELKHSSTGQQSQKPKAEPKQEARHNANESQANPQYKPYDSTRQPPPKPRQQPESHHPWRRMAARYIDMNFFAFVGAIGFALLSLGTENPVVNQLLYAVVAMASCILLEPVVLAMFGGTPGKAILNISVESKTYPSIQTVPFSDLLKRTFQVYFFGLGLGLFLIVAPFFFMFKDYKLMKQTGFTRWDKVCGTQVSFGDMGLFRFLVGAALVLSFMTLNLVGKSLNRSERKEWYAAKYHSGENSQTISTQTANPEVFDWANAKPVEPEKASLKKPWELDWAETSQEEQPKASLPAKLRPFDRDESSIKWDNNEETKTNDFSYSGEKISFNFQNIPISSVLAILADFSNLNFVVTESVQGNVTMEYKDIPWDQALDIILKAKNLAQQREGNTIKIMTLNEFNELKQEDARTQFILGSNYANGEGVLQDYAEAASWYRKAAVQGNPDAQFALGSLYNFGRGVIQNRAEAAKWYRMAASQGNPVAQEMLNKLYRNQK
ncbi:MAG: hypothetical protein DM484_10860 [Candidatus Methylumidiphilus alinenensis]|uniref:J domain-containing protein n=1 Tax=Candidatus Methylumidiphilus alinenensis TaxID=2202197 RepID=A0A2W4R7D6_9GAMM|nr:MAG: hypothetical protein DM484_10860 [Candidatus Methylumidiphilus alinenensis]